MLKRTMAVAAAAMAAVGATTLTGLSNDTTPATDAAPLQTAAPGSPANPSRPILVSSFHETYGSDTPQQWASNADHIAEVTITGEKRGTQEAGWVNRIVTVKVDATRWSRAGATELPATFDMKSWGWTTSSDGLQEVAAKDASRVEPGHRYIMALIRLQPRCNADDGIVTEGGWTIIGSHGVVPFDGGQVGEGELEGVSDQTLDGIPGTVAAISESADSTADIVDTVAEAETVTRPDQPGVREGC